MEKLLSTKEWKKLTDELSKIKYTCKCGHRVYIAYSQDKKLCSWCHNYVFKTKRDEFNFRMAEMLKRS